jgi:hypothetical protein
LRAMNRGQTEELQKPMPVRKTGAPFALGEWKLKALLQEYPQISSELSWWRRERLIKRAVL